MEGPAMWRGLRLYLNSYGHQVSNHVDLISTTVHSEFENNQKEYTKSNIEEYCNRVLKELSSTKSLPDLIYKKDNIGNWSKYRSVGVATVISLHSSGKQTDNLKIKHNFGSFISAENKDKNCLLKVKKIPISNSVIKESCIGSSVNESKLTDLKITCDKLSRKKSFSKLFSECYSDGDSQLQGLIRAQLLRKEVLSKKKEKKITTKIYHSMLKAFGMCRDIASSLEILGEMKKDNINITVSTINMLLQCCLIYDQQSFHFALQVWQEMRKLNIVPNIQSYHLLLKCLSLSYLKDEQNISGFGMIQDILKASKNCLTCRSNESLLINRSESDFVFDKTHLLGGVQSLIQLMKRDQVQPDITIFKILLTCVPSTYANEETLLSELQKNKIVPDYSFYASLVCQRSHRHEFRNAIEVVSALKSHNIDPTSEIFKFIAVSCLSLTEARVLLPTLNNLSNKQFGEIMEILINNSLSKKDYYYTYEILNVMKQNGVAVSKETLLTLERTYFDLKSQISQNNPAWASKEYNGSRLFVLEFNNVIRDSSSLKKDLPLVSKELSPLA